MKKAVFTGSFDPLTKGHEAIVLQALPLFDEIIVAIGVNIDKKYYFPLEKRLQWLKDTFSDYDKVKVTHYEGLTVDFCKNNGVNYIVRGLRSAADFDYECLMAEANKKLNPQIETVFLVTDPALRCISSSLVRDILKNHGDVAQFVPSHIVINQ